MKIVTRKEWGARLPRSITLIGHPLDLVVTHHGVSPTTNPDAQWRGYQRLHMDGQGWSDIAYNWGIAADGRIFEGRGWDRVGGATGSPWDRQSMSVCWIGNFQNDVPTQAALDAFVWLLHEGVRLGKLTKTFRLAGHRDFAATACCGDNLYVMLPSVREAVYAEAQRRATVRRLRNLVRRLRARIKAAPNVKTRKRIRARLNRVLGKLREARG